jgi:hypothetical protein
MGASVQTLADGTLRVVLPKLGPIDLDRQCVYPVINQKTGGHTHTFATWQADLSRTSAMRFVTGEVLLLLSLQENSAHKTVVEFSSNCFADTEIGRQPAESVGIFEQRFLARLFAAAGQQLGSIPTARHSIDAPAEEEYSETRDISPGVHTRRVRSLLPGVSDRTLVKVSVSSPSDTAWRAIVQVMSDFAQQTARPPVKINEQLRTVEVGPAAKGDAPAERWNDWYVASVSSDGSQTRLSVIRELRVSADGGASWHGAPSDGEIESWILTRAVAIVAAASQRPTEPIKVIAPDQHQNAVPCTVEQVLALKQAGLTDAQVRAACSTN